MLRCESCSLRQVSGQVLERPKVVVPAVSPRPPGTTSTSADNTARVPDPFPAAFEVGDGCKQRAFSTCASERAPLEEEGDLWAVCHSRETL